MERPGVTPVHPRPKRRAPWPVEFYRSGIGKKWVMAVTGLMIMGFVFFHAFGNLKVYFGAESFNHYGEFLRELLVPLLPRTWGLWLLRDRTSVGSGKSVSVRVDLGGSRVMKKKKRKRRDKKK